MQDLRSYFYVFFNFFKQCFVVQCASLSPLRLLLSLLYFIRLDATLLGFFLILFLIVVAQLAKNLPAM